MAKQDCNTRKSNPLNSSDDFWREINCDKITASEYSKALATQVAVSIQLKIFPEPILKAQPTVTLITDGDKTHTVGDVIFTITVKDQATADAVSEALEQQK